MIADITPVIGTITRRRHSGRQGFVQATGAAGITVRWLDTGRQSIHPPSELTGGFLVNMEVQHKPANAIYPSLGWGIVRATQELAGQSMVLVEFLEAGERRWLPWQRLRFVRGVKQLFHTARFDAQDAAERMRLRLLAWAIRLWNENTGALATFDIDPLPHQVHLVHHILASGQYNWLIADDVGLGKTIEIGLLLAALRQRGEARRVLLVTPAGLTRQWQEELAGKFGLDGFRIYRDDFAINDARHWKMYDQVIGSIDRFKQEHDRELLLQAEPWDLVIVDEAHRLTRRQYGNKLDASQRYNVLQDLRSRCESLVLLTATPHQGKEDSFKALLELLHPERRHEIAMLQLNPEILGDMVFRNYKADVTDMEGNFLFRGKTTRQIEVPQSVAAEGFDGQLQDYLRRGYAAEAAAGTQKARAIGFVMMVYRKLAASSIAAIHAALVRRWDRLNGGDFSHQRRVDDARYAGEAEERSLDESSISPFFTGEHDLLQSLIDRAESLRESDTKLHAFLEGLVDAVLKHDAHEKILIFTEYRATLAWVQSALNARFGADSTVAIHGSMDITERRDAIASFSDPAGAQFLISTEAGGEGINLQEQCHVMVNYDLPWNPMRLVQRTGRLYRYGQTRRVVVFNMHQSGSADDRVLDILYERLTQVAADMANVQAREFNDATQEDILGELAELMDVGEVLEGAAHEDVGRTQARIEEALARARAAVTEQQELFRHAASFNPDEIRGEMRITTAHLQSFVSGMCTLMGITILERTHKGLVWHLHFSETASHELGVKRMHWQAVFDRMLAAQHPDFLPMTTDNWFLAALMAKAARYEFGGIGALCRNPPAEAWAGMVMRWQNDRGRRVRQELAIIAADADVAEIDPAWASEWLLEPQAPGIAGECPSPERSKALFTRMEQAADRTIARRRPSTLLPEQPQWLAGAFGANGVGEPAGEGAQ